MLCPWKIEWNTTNYIHGLFRIMARARSPKKRHQIVCQTSGRQSTRIALDKEETGRLVNWGYTRIEYVVPQKLRQHERGDRWLGLHRIDPLLASNAETTSNIMRVREIQAIKSPVQSDSSIIHDAYHFTMKENWRAMQINEPGRHIDFLAVRAVILT